MVATPHHVRADTAPGLDAARAFFAAEQLPFPPVPDKLLVLVRPLSPGIYGTRGRVPGPYNFDWFLRDARGAQTGDYTLFGHDGHGANSWAMHFYLVFGRLALFIQHAWGGSHVDASRARARLRRSFDEARELLATAAGDSWPATAANSRLLVVVSDYHDSGWQIIVNGAVQEWQPSSGPMFAALEWLRAGASEGIV